MALTEWPPKPGETAPRAQVKMKVTGPFGFCIGNGRDVFPGNVFICEEEASRIYSLTGRAEEISDDEFEKAVAAEQAEVAKRARAAAKSKPAEPAPAPATNTGDAGGKPDGAGKPADPAGNTDKK